MNLEQNEIVSRDERQKARKELQAKEKEQTGSGMSWLRHRDRYGRP